MTDTPPKLLIQVWLTFIGGPIYGTSPWLCRVSWMKCSCRQSEAWAPPGSFCGFLHFFFWCANLDHNEYEDNKSHREDKRSRIMRRTPTFTMMICVPQQSTHILSQKLFLDTLLAVFFWRVDSFFNLSFRFTWAVMAPWLALCAS